MPIDINRRNFFTAFFFDTADTYLKDFTDDPRFSWDDFWKNICYIPYMKQTTDELFAIALNQEHSHEERVSAIDSMQYPILNDELKVLIQEIKNEYYQKKKIAYTSFEDRLPEIISFFKTYRNIDLETLSNEDRFDAIHSDHATLYEDPNDIPIHKAMGLSVFEYRYLYQMGGYHK